MGNNNKNKGKLKAVEMECCRRSNGLTKLDKVRNDKIGQRAGGRYKHHRNNRNKTGNNGPAI